MRKHSRQRRLKSRKKSFIKPGSAPGSIEVTPGSSKPIIYVTAYSVDKFHEQTVDSLDDIVPLRQKWPTIWIHVQGLGDAAIITRLGEMFSLHRLALEDVVSRSQQPKLEPYDGHLYLVARAVPDDGGLDFAQANIFIGENFVITLQERNIDWDEPVRKRIREGQSRIRKLGANYLGYALLDSIVDCYFPMIEQYSERLDAIEEVILAAPAEEDISRIHEVRTQLLAIRHPLSPLREVVKILASEELPPIAKETRLYFRDCLDHLKHLTDTIETNRELARSLIDLCLSSLSNQMNEVMKVLTIIATIFIPLGFIAGLYGMNFNPEISPYNLPELNWRLGYPYVLSLMALTTTSLLVYFRRKGWLGKPKR